MSTQSRGQLSHHLAKTENATTWHRLGKGIESLDSAMNPQTTEKTWIDDSSESTTTGYQPAWAVNGDIYDGDEASQLLYDMTWHRAKNDDAQVYMIVCKHWEAGTSPGSFKAYKQLCSWAPESDGGGSGGETVTFSGSLNAKGDPVYGEFNPETTTFTAD